MADEIITKNIRIFGRVQGVGFRMWVKTEADLKKLKGWVRNRRDGSVEAVVTGLERDVTQFVSSCNKGPANAKVETVQVFDGVDEELEDFEIRDTA